MAEFFGKPEKINVYEEEIKDNVAAVQHWLPYSIRGQPFSVANT